MDQSTTKNIPLILIDPKTIQVDAATYQFRAGGDKKNGVTPSGRYSDERWDPILHGAPLLLHERLDGSIFVVDGHHRLELAKRTNQNGTGPGQIVAQLLRESEGFTAKDARLIGAYKNMSHGGVDPIDGARALKEAKHPDVHLELLPTLKMKGNIALSVTLSGLSDKALDAAQAKKIPAYMAAEVARRVPDDAAKQESVMRAIGEMLGQRNPSPVSHASYSIGPVRQQVSVQYVVNRHASPQAENRLPGALSFVEIEKSRRVATAQQASLSR